MIVLAAVYQPGPRLLEFAAELRAADPALRLLVVDDGSGPASAPVLEAVPGTVVRLGANQGKGAALKAGLRLVDEDVVCADPDGQHQVSDVLRVAERVRSTGHMVLGVRRFEGSVPLRSRVGNAVTGRLFRMATGRRVTDTQTGLRGFPRDLVAWLTTVDGERYEYEMNVLLAAAGSGRPIEQVEIETRYEKDNAGSHFSSLTDSVRIYWPLVRHALTRR